MVNAELRTLHNVDGTPVCNVSFDLSAAQLTAAAHAIDAMRVHRHRGQEMATDDVLALRELTALADELHRLNEHGAHGTVVLQLARLVTLHDAIGDWVAETDARGWMREADVEAHRLLMAMLSPMAELRADAVRATLATHTETSGC
jgi:hypothetical protein